VLPPLTHAPRRAPGLLYEDQYLQIGAKCEFRDAHGRIGLFLGNKHAQPLHNLRVELHAGPGVSVQDVSSVPATLGERQQVQVTSALTCTAAFPAGTQSLTTLSVSFHVSDTQQVAFTLPLPVVPTKFLVPAPVMEKAQFYDAWRALAGPPQKLETVLQVKPEFAAGGLASWHSLFAALRLHVKPGVDPNQLNVFAASSLCAASGATTLCIVRLESDARNAAQFRLTVASPDGVLCAAVREMVMLQVAN
jgi:AP-2 complex subunit alpha